MNEPKKDIYPALTVGALRALLYGLTDQEQRVYIKTADGIQGVVGTRLHLENNGERYITLNLQDEPRWSKPDYFTLCIRDEHGKWSPEFGAYDRQTVEDEMEDCSEEFCDMKIIVSGASSHEVASAVMKLNNK